MRTFLPLGAVFCIMLGEHYFNNVGDVVLRNRLVIKRYRRIVLALLVKIICGSYKAHPRKQ
jgi:hypothetical protein